MEAASCGQGFKRLRRLTYRPQDIAFNSELFPAQPTYLQKKFPKLLTFENWFVYNELLFFISQIGSINDYK